MEFDKAPPKSRGVSHLLNGWDYASFYEYRSLIALGTRHI